MQGVAPAKQHEGSWIPVEPFGLVFRIQDAADGFEVVFPGPGFPDAFHILEHPPTGRPLSQERDGKRRVVKVPSERLPFAGAVDVDGRQRIGVCVQPGLPESRAQKLSKCRGAIQPAQHGVRGNLIVGDAPIGR